MKLLRRPLMAVVFLVLVCHAQSHDADTASVIPESTPIAKVVRDLGKDDTDLDRIRFLAKRPAESAPLLIAELRPVAGVRVLGDQHYQAKWRHTEHVIWCLRALRAITGGLNFRAATNHDFGDTEVERRREWFIGGEQYPNDRTVKFFGVWMSRDSVYIAPRDAQVKIIEMWKNWYETRGKEFVYPPFKSDPDIYYF